jgi:hypothetical protein
MGTLEKKFCEDVDCTGWPECGCMNKYPLKSDCQGCETVMLNVHIQASHSHNGQGRWCEKPVDKCVADIVQALNDAGVLTVASCCGHGCQSGKIALLDGREISVRSARNT